MKRNGETVEYQVALNIPHLREKNQQNLRESPGFLREWRKPVRKNAFWLSLWESWRGAPERARTPTKRNRRSGSIALPKRQLIAAWRLSGDGLALSVIAYARQGRVAAPSVCFAAACILLAAAPTAPPCFRRWRRSSPLPPKGEALAKPFTLRGLPKPPLGRGGGTASAVTERLSPAAAHGQALS